LTEIVLVGSGSFLGGNARYFLATFVADRWGSNFPYGTFIINATGSLLIGLLLTYILAHASLSPNYRLIFVVGFLGAYTTFSTYTFDALTLMQNGEWLKSFIYLLGTVVLGMVCVTLGMLAGRALD
jgi:CrcB protein